MNATSEFLPSFFDMDNRYRAKTACEPGVDKKIREEDFKHE